MCSKISPPRLKPPTTATDAVIIEETATAAVKMKPRQARKNRSKTRKRKYLSLLLELSPENTPHSSLHMTTTTAATTSAANNHRHHHQLNLFPLYPDNLMEEKLDTHEDNMAASFFPTTDGGAATLTGLLSATGTSISTSEEAEDATLSPSSMNYEEGELVKTAMRNKERDASEEKWVCYSEVVEKKEEEVSSSGAAAEERRYKMKGLSLKLDYNKIMNAWSDKGPLYIRTESPQTVPDLHDDDFLSSSSAAVNGLWSVPEMSETGVDGKLELSKTSVREASVQRYKEKRQNRLFAKKIRYQVRKLNAEKRPRIKGRFVKRS